jgi:hypothetical protein
LQRLYQGGAGPFPSTGPRRPGTTVAMTTVAMTTVATNTVEVDGVPGSSDRAGADLPLVGVRVVDLTDGRAEGCARLLGDLGADVIRVEPPGGSDEALDTPQFSHRAAFLHPAVGRRCGGHRARRSTAGRGASGSGTGRWCAG